VSELQRAKPSQDRKLGRAVVLDELPSTEYEQVCSGKGLETSEALHPPATSEYAVHPMSPLRVFRVIRNDDEGSAREVVSKFCEHAFENDFIAEISISIPALDDNLRPGNRVLLRLRIRVMGNKPASRRVAGTQPDRRFDFQHEFV